MSSLDHLEDACPALFQPRQPATFLLQDKPHDYIWVREYINTDMVAWVNGGWVHFQRRIDGGKRATRVRESAWAKAPCASPAAAGRAAIFCE